MSGKELEVGLRAMIAEVVREELGKVYAQPAIDGYLSTTRAAKLADVATGTIRRWIREGRIAAHGSGRTVRIKRTDLDALLKRGRRPANDLSPEQLAARDFR